METSHSGVVQVRAKFGAPVFLILGAGVPPLRLLIGGLLVGLHGRIGVVDHAPTLAPDCEARVKGRATEGQAPASARRSTVSAVAAVMRANVS